MQTEIEFLQQLLQELEYIEILGTKDYKKEKARQAQLLIMSRISKLKREVDATARK